MTCPDCDRRVRQATATTRRGLFRRCPHTTVRCVHGDEIIHAGYSRSQCLDCGRYLKPLPDTCSVTGASHQDGGAP